MLHNQPVMHGCGHSTRVMSAISPTTSWHFSMLTPTFISTVMELGEGAIRLSLGFNVVMLKEHFG